MNTYLSSNELFIIREFIDDVIKLPIVESVYLVSFVTNTRKFRIMPVAVINNTEKYNKKISAFYPNRDVAGELEELQSILSNYRKEYAMSRVGFMVDSIANYSIKNYKRVKDSSLNLLVGGYVIIDRFHYIENTKSKIQGKIQIPSNIGRVDNSFELIPEEEKAKKNIDRP